MSARPYTTLCPVARGDSRKPGGRSPVPRIGGLMRHRPNPSDASSSECLWKHGNFTRRWRPPFEVCRVTNALVDRWGSKQKKRIRPNSHLSPSLNQPARAPSPSERGWPNAEGPHRLRPSAPPHERNVREAHRTADEARRSELLDKVNLLNQCVAEAVANRYRGRGVPAEDLHQAAFEGLVKAVHEFDPTVRPDLLTYAVPTMRGEVQRWFRDGSWMVRPPRQIQELQWRVSRSIESLAQDLGREPTDAELSRGRGLLGRRAERDDPSVRLLPATLARQGHQVRRHRTLGDTSSPGTTNVPRSKSRRCSNRRAAAAGARPQDRLPALLPGPDSEGDRRRTRGHPDTGVPVAGAHHARSSRRDGLVATARSRRYWPPAM